MSSSPDLNINLAIEISDGWLRSMREKLIKNTSESAGLHPTIFRVPPHVRIKDERAFDPKTISIGPYHRGKEMFKTMENLKWHYLRRFLRRNLNCSLEDHLKKMKQLEPRSRTFYSEPIELCSDEFAEMLVLDGSFIVELLLSTMCGLQNGTDHGYDPVSTTSWALAHITFDLLLLENQIPFFILLGLYDYATVSYETKPSLVTVVHKLFTRFVYMRFIIPEITSSDIHHLLHLFHTSILPPLEHPSTAKYSWWIRTCAYLRLCKIEVKEEIETEVISIPNAVQLHEAGIKFRENTSLAPLEAKFRNGVIEMPGARIGDYTIPLLLNLIAFEQCNPSTGAHVTSYACFMDNLVNNHTDIALLQREGVLLNGLGSEEEAAHMFNQLCKNVVLSSGKSHLRHLKSDVNRYYSSRWPRWRKRLVHDYFGNPWAIISLIAAAILLSFTIVQTIFTILSYKLA